MAKLDDTVTLDPGIKPEDVISTLVENVNLGWRQGGNDGRCNVPANFVAWLLEERARLHSTAQNLVAAIDNMHERGETFTGRVSIAVADMRKAL